MVSATAPAGATVFGAAFARTGGGALSWAPDWLARSERLATTAPTADQRQRRLMHAPLEAHLIIRHRKGPIVLLGSRLVDYLHAAMGTFRFPHPLLLLVGGVLIAAMLTWALPAGEY